jgi:hypothetical protein
MTSISLGCITLALFCCHPVAVNGQTSLFKTVYTKQELLDLGIYRASDVLTIAPGWYAYSTDGYAPFISNNGFNNYDSHQWTVLIDDQPITYPFTKHLSLNDLPLDINLVDSIVFADSYLTQNYQLLKNVIQFYTSRGVQPALNFVGSVSMGNEINDPGPYKYTPLVSPNVDRIGPDLSLGITSQIPSLKLHGLINHKEHHLSDQQLLERTERIHDINDHRPRMINTSSLLMAQWSKKSAYLSLQSLSTTIHGFPFYQMIDQEVPQNTSMRDHYLVIHQRFKRSTIHSEFQWSTKRVDVRPNNLFMDTVFYDHGIRHALSFEYHGQALLFSMGYQLDAHATTKSIQLNPLETYPTTFKLLQHIAYRRHRWNFYFNTQWKIHSNQLIPNFETRFSFNDALSLNIGYGREPEAPSLVYPLSEANSGFTSTLSKFRIPYRESLSYIDRKRLTIGFEMQHTIKPSFTFGGKFTYNDTESTLSDWLEIPGSKVKTRIDPGIQDKALSFTIWQKTVLFSKVYVSSHYQTFIDIKSSPVFQQRAQEIPIHRAVNALIFRPYDSFSFSLLQQWQSKTNWVIEPRFQKNTLSRPTVLQTPLDLQFHVNKALFKNRYYIAFGLKNILNKPIQSYPIGAQLDMIFEINTGLQLTTSRNR